MDVLEDRCLDSFSGCHSFCAASRFCRAAPRPMHSGDLGSSALPRPHRIDLTIEAIDACYEALLQGLSHFMVLHKYCDLIPDNSPSIRQGMHGN